VVSQEAFFGRFDFAMRPFEQTTERKVMPIPQSAPSIPVLPSSNVSGGRPGPTAARAYLMLLSRPGSRTGGPGATPLSTPLLIIGSDPSCGLRLFDPTVSPRHARIESRGEQWLIRDLQSEFGVYINDTQITEAPLTDLDRIQVGDSIFVFRIGEE
jgi:pSer/pThr/pTyr-binding forkhead associated (FHA) protein